jgi:hypothetical protein
MVWGLLGLASTLVGAAALAWPEVMLEALVTLIALIRLGCWTTGGRPRQRDADDATLEFATGYQERRRVGLTAGRPAPVLVLATEYRLYLLLSTWFGPLIGYFLAFVTY